MVDGLDVERVLVAGVVEDAIIEEVEMGYDMLAADNKVVEERAILVILVLEYVEATSDEVPVEFECQYAVPFWLDVSVLFEYGPEPGDGDGNPDETLFRIEVLKVCAEGLAVAKLRKRRHARLLKSRE